MSYSSLLVNSASVYRNTPGLADDYGYPAPSWAIVLALSDIACRIMSGNGKEILVGAEVVVADYKLFLGDVVLSEQDRVKVWWGSVPAWYEYEILQVNDIQDGINSHHKECYLRIVR